MMPTDDTPAYAAASERMCTTAMAASRAQLPSHEDSALLQWRREAVQHRVSDHVSRNHRSLQ